MSIPARCLWCGHTWPGEGDSCPRCGVVLRPMTPTTTLGEIAAIVEERLVDADRSGYVSVHFLPIPTGLRVFVANYSDDGEIRVAADVVDP